MSRATSIVLTLGLVASVAALAFCWNRSYEGSIGSPRQITPTTITISNKTEDGVNWVATLALSPNGRLQQVQLDCDGRPYATVPVGADFPPNASGAFFSAYLGTSCTEGRVELTVFTIPTKMGFPSVFIPAVFDFKDGRFVSSDVRGLEHLPLSDIEKYCPEKKV